MPKSFLRICVVVLAASLALALTPVASHASGLTGRPAVPPSHGFWIDAARAVVGALFPAIPPARPLSAAPARSTANVSHHRGWLQPNCQSVLLPGGGCA
jgi:hypothetical protein